MCFQYGGQSSLRTKTVRIVFLIIHICIDTATSRISRFGGKTCPVYILTQYVSSKWVFQKLLSKFQRKIVAVLRTWLITRVDTLFSRYIGPYLLVSLHIMIKYWIVETVVYNLVQRKAAFWFSRVRNKYYVVPWYVKKMISRFLVCSLFRATERCPDLNEKDRYCDSIATRRTSYVTGSDKGSTF